MFKKKTQAEREADAAAKAKRKAERDAAKAERDAAKAKKKADKKAKKHLKRRKKDANLDEHKFNQFYGDPNSTGKKITGKRIGKEKSLRPCDANFQW